MKVKFLTASFFGLLMLGGSLAVFAQTNAQIEKELIAANQEIQTYGTYGGGYDEDKLTKAQNDFQEKLLKYTKNDSTLAYKFAALGKEIFIATSDDGKFRIYSWDLEDGGTMHDYARVYQYVGADGKIYSQTNENSGDAETGGGSFVTDIYTLDAAKNGKVYIVCSTFVGSTKINGQSADLYKIEGDKLDSKVKLIKTKSGLTNELSFGYDFFSVVDRNDRPIKLISFDNKTKILKIPVVIDDNEFPDGRVTNKFISYQFNGANFVKIN